MCIFYATAVIEQATIASIWPAALMLMAAIVPGAFYVSVINDITDRAEDERAGKVNRLAGKPRWLLAMLVAAPLGVGVVFTLMWRNAPLLAAAYLCAWAAFSLYSLPPFRLKSRGVLGIIADASGAHLFPTLVAALLAFHALGRNIDPAWIAAVAVWAFACGLRGILWHQLYDAENDRQAGVRTFVLQHSPRVAADLARYVVFPLELIALGFLLWRIQSIWLMGALSLYVAFEALRVRTWKMVPIVAQPCDRFSIVGLDFYRLFFPLGILIASALRHPADWAVLAVHLIIFSGPAILIAAESRRLVRDLIAHSRFARSNR